MSVSRFVSAAARVFKTLKPHEKENWEQQVWWMLEGVTGRGKAQLLASPASQEQTLRLAGHHLPVSLRLSATQFNQLSNWLDERLSGKPLQYVMGRAAFCGHDFLMKPPVFIPRPETEQWCSWLISYLEKQYTSKGFSILDLCSGSGCISLSLARHFPFATVVGVDRNPDAIELANANITELKLPNATFVEADVMATTKSLQQCLPVTHFDVIVSNPPYIPNHRYSELDSEVTAWEDPSALFSEENGLHTTYAIIEHCATMLKPPNVAITELQTQIVIEFGEESQELALLRKLRLSGFVGHVCKDWFGRSRWLTAGWKRN